MVRPGFDFLSQPSLAIIPGPLITFNHKSAGFDFLSCHSSLSFPALLLPSSTNRPASSSSPVIPAVPIYLSFSALLLPSSTNRPASSSFPVIPAVPVYLSFSALLLPSSTNRPVSSSSPVIPAVPVYLSFSALLLPSSTNRPASSVLLTVLYFIARELWFFDTIASPSPNPTVSVVHRCYSHAADWFPSRAEPWPHHYVHHPFMQVLAVFLISVGMCSPLLELFGPLSNVFYS